jgi:hypothetical protein
LESSEAVLSTRKGGFLMFDRGFFCIHIQ